MPAGERANGMPMGSRMGRRAGGRLPDEEARDVVLEVHVTPRAKQSAVAGRRDEAWLVRLQAAPVDGAANEALIDLLCRMLRLPARQITIVAGATARRKRLRVIGLDRATVEARLSAQGTAGGRTVRPTSGGSKR
jgi:uncharacterized protein